ALALAPAQSAAAVAAVCTALAYSLLAGWGVPAQRTFLMLTVVAIALTRRRPASGATSLMLAAVVVCLADPWAVIAPGFWLSFGAVAAIMWAMSGQMSLAAQLSVWRQRLRSAIRVQLAVSLALIPMTIALFAQVSLVSPLANAVAIPVVSWLVTPIALLAALLSVLPEPLAQGAGPLLSVAHALFAWLVGVLQFLVQLPKAAVAWAVPPMWTLLCAMLGVAWLWAPRGWPLRAVGLVWLLPAIVWPAQRPAADELWVTALDVGQGTAVILQTQDATALYDTGARFSEQTDAGSRVIAPYFRYHGIDALDLLVVSHLDSDHSGGAVSVMAAVKTQQLLTSIDLSDAKHVAFARGAQRSERCLAGQQGRLGAARWQFLHPSADDYEAASRLRRLSTNRLSCVMMLRFGRHRVLLAGDILKAQEKQLLARSAVGALGPVTVLFAPHHGSHSSSSLDWALATSPRWVAYTVGYHNRFGHPHEDILERYAALGAQTARTDFDGAITWRLRANGGVSIVRARQVQRRYWHNVVPRLGVDT
ncbi:MAG TPA: DNA internalization-related competence protein ComEC/Rec2, partial [Burkholderiaceae bacterium]|nr:DNA internalization-related competence protein ComEC/Rec2 [Burkholderiaceae bacterium]